MGQILPSYQYSCFGWNWRFFPLYFECSISISKPYYKIFEMSNGFTEVNHWKSYPYGKTGILDSLRIFPFPSWSNWRRIFPPPRVSSWRRILPSPRLSSWRRILPPPRVSSCRRMLPSPSWSSARPDSSMSNTKIKIFIFFFQTDYK